MPDRLEKLRATVLELENQLQNPSDLDPAARELLTAAARDIQAALAHSTVGTALSGSSAPGGSASGSDSAASSGAAADQRDAGLTSRISDAARQFETEHPTLAGILERIADGLAQLGI